MKKKSINRLGCISFIAGLLLCICSAALGQNYTMTNSWAINAGSVNWFSSSANSERSMAYNPATGHLLVVSRASGNRVVILNAADGSSNSLLNLTGIMTSGSSITFAISQICCTTDGVIYLCDLTSPASNTTNNFIVYRWANESATPSIAFQGSVSSSAGGSANRYGDNLALTGSGTGTILAAGANAGGGIIFLTTTDGATFSVTGLTNSTATSGDLQPGLDFYSTNSYFSKHAGATAFHYSTLNLATGTTQETTTNSALSGYGPLKVGASSNWLCSLFTTTAASGTGHYVSLYNIGTGSPFGNLTYVTSNAMVATAGSGNGNLTGAVAISGSNVYVLDTDVSIEAFQILPVVVLTPPAATVSPASETEYAGNPGFSFTASTTGSLPISFQWYFTSNGVTSPLSGATNQSYSFSPATTNMAGSYFVAVSNAAGTNVSAAVTLTVQTPFATGRMTNLWSLQPGSRFYLDNASYDQRGLAYDPLDGSLLLASRYPTNCIAVLNATTGADKWLMNVDPSVINGANATYPLNLVGVGDDGVVYGVPLVLAGQTGFQLFVWNDDTPGSEPQFAFQGDPGNGLPARWGDSMAVKGAGGDTMILLGPGGATNIVSVLTSSDGGFTFNPTVLTVTDPNNSSLVGFAQLGIAWGPGNTFWTKSVSYNLRQISYNLQAGTATVLNNYNTPFQGTQGTAIGVDVTNSLLAMLAFDSPPSVRLYDIWFAQQNPNITPDLVDQGLFPVNFPNQNFTGAVAFADPYFWVLDSNNGLEAYQIDTSVLSAFNVQPPSIQGANTVLSWPSKPGRTYEVQVQRQPSIGTNWANAAAPFASSSSTTTFTDTAGTGTNAYYQVIGR